jgi:DNA polymerase III subunit epsilon
VSHLVTGDEEFRETTFLVVDFEGTTPRGRRPEPIDVAALQLRWRDRRLREVERFSALMCPPEHAPVTSFDTAQTGITPRMVAGQPRAAEVLGALDVTLTTPPYVLVAHHAPTEAGILFDYREHCPRLAGTSFLDTVRLARIVYPTLTSHRLDMLLQYLGIPRPHDRHRALPDVEVTVEVFLRILADGRWDSLRQLYAAGGYRAKAAQPRQQELF